MKICPKCEAQNDDVSVICKDCGCTISKIPAIAKKDYMEELEAKNKRRHRKKMLIHNVLVTAFGIVYIYLLFKCLQAEFLIQLLLVFILLPIIAYLQIHHPRALFVLKHIFTIDNIDDVDVSDLYIWVSKIGGILLMIAALGFLTAMFISTR